MNSQSHALGYRANGFKQVFALRRAWFRVHHHVGRHNLSNALLDGVAERVHLLEARGARHAHGGIHEVAIAGSPHAHAIHVQDAVHARNGARDLLLQSFGRGIEQRVDRTAAKLRADPQDHGRYGQGGKRVGINQIGHVPGFTGPHQTHAGDDDGRAPDIGRKMQRVGLQRLAGEFSRHMQQRPGARQVNAESAEQDHDGGDARLDMHAAKEKAAKRFVNNVQRCEQKQPGLDERGKILEFSVAIGMLFVGGPIRHPHGEKRDNCGDQVQTGVQRLR